MILGGIIAILLSLFPVANLSPDGAKDEPAPSPYRILDSAIEGLARANAAFNDVNAKAERPSLVDRMASIQNANIELEVICRYLQPLRDETSGNTAFSIESMIGSYTAMRQSLDMSLQLYEILDAAKSEEDLAGLRRKISDAKVRYQQGCRLLVESTTLLFATILVPDPKDPKNHTALPLTAREKARLIEKLTSRFGPKLHQKAQDDDIGPLQAARILVTALEKNWRLAPGEIPRRPNSR